MSTRDDHPATIVDRIVASASVQLRSCGVGDLRIRAVAKGAGVSPGTVTYYFPTTRELLEAVLTGFQRAAWEVFNRRVDVESGSVDPALVEELFELCCGWREEVRARLYLLSVSGEVSGDNWKGSLAPLLDALEAMGGTAMRLRGHAFVWLVMRYAIHTDDELLAITGCGSGEAARAAILEHLAEAAGLSSSGSASASSTVTPMS